MSGGSFDYLAYQDNPSDDLIERMAEELDALALKGVPGAFVAAVRTRQYLRPKQPDPVRDVWRAVEWWRSADYGEDDVVEALQQYLLDNSHPDL